jgi:hypothetical protein
MMAKTAAVTHDFEIIGGLAVREKNESLTSRMPASKLLPLGLPL